MVIFLHISVDSQPREFLWVKFFTGPIHWGQGEIKERVSCSRLIGGTFNKQGNWHRRLALGHSQTSRSRHLLCRILKAYVEVLPWFSHVCSPDALNNTLLSQVLEVVPSMGTVHLMYICSTGEAVRSLWLPGSDLQVNWRSCPLIDLVQQFHYWSTEYWNLLKQVHENHLFSLQESKLLHHLYVKNAMFGVII